MTKDDTVSYTIPSELPFRVSPRTMRMLGRENISSPIISVLELVKNAYDADATSVKVIFENTNTPSGRIIIKDNGEGMSLDDLRNRWMVISTSNKIRSSTTALKARKKVGEKGIGRLAMDRLARQVTVRTHRHDSSGLELFIDWDKYEGDEGELNQISHPLQSVPPRDNGLSGTTLILTNLRDQWKQNDFEALYNDLSLLVAPLAQEGTDFSIYFESSDAPELSGKVSSILTNVAEYTLISTLDKSGILHHQLTHRSGEAIEDQRSWANAFSLPSGALSRCGPLHFKLLFYLRDAKSFQGTDVKLSQLRKSLQRYHGVRIYRDAFRVKPYGDPGGNEDWLRLNARFIRTRYGVQSKLGWRLSEGQVIGTVLITRKKNPALRDQTNREGLIENDAYNDMKKFLLHGIQFLERERQSRVHREKEKKEADTAFSIPVENSFADIEEHLDTISTELRNIAEKPSIYWHDDVRKLADSVDKVRSQPLRDLQETIDEEHQEAEQRQTEYQLMIGLSTLGITMTAFGHEIERVINNVQARTKLLTHTINRSPIDKPRIDKDMKVLSESAGQVQAWGRFALERVRQDKRKRTDIDINKIIHTLLEEFHFSLMRERIQIEINLSKELPFFRAFTMDIEAIFINFITNAKEAMRYTAIDQRKIVIWTYFSEVSQELRLGFADSGCGIRDEDVNLIFDPLFSTRLDDDGEPVGTGLGLTIVKNIIDDYNGRIDVKGSGKLGGAEFNIYLPHLYGRRKQNDTPKNNLVN